MSGMTQITMENEDSDQSLERKVTVAKSSVKKMEIFFKIGIIALFIFWIFLSFVTRTGEKENTPKPVPSSPAPVWPHPLHARCRISQEECENKIKECETLRQSSTTYNICPSWPSKIEGMKLGQSFVLGKDAFDVPKCPEEPCPSVPISCKRTSTSRQPKSSKLENLTRDELIDELIQDLNKNDIHWTEFKIVKTPQKGTKTTLESVRS